MVDFDALVLAPTMNLFARPVQIVPIKSKPNTPVPYAARGIWSVRNIDVPMEDSSIYSDTIYTLGIRLSEFDVVPVPEDKVIVDGIAYLIDDLDPDGQGGSVISLKSITAP